MKTKRNAIFIYLFTILAFLLATCIGSQLISPAEIGRILCAHFFPTGQATNISEIHAAIFMKVRLPRTLMAFLVGACLSVSGTMMQSILQNPLASSYTLGVSSGASLGAALIILALSSFSLPGIFLPITAFVFGLLTVFLAIFFTNQLDQRMENQTIILVGMVLSLFVNAILTMITSLFSNHLQRFMFWSMGSFASTTWEQMGLILPFILVAFLLACCFTKEMDIMTFGEVQAKSVGVPIKRVKLLLITLSALLTGVCVAFCGTIGFIDLIAPHMVRKLFGPSHKYVIPFSALLGGGFMMLADLISRTILSPRQLPVGAVTALIGAPFFAYIYFHKEKGGRTSC